MHEEIIRDLLYQILGCGWRDIDFISSISYKTWTEINIDEIKRAWYYKCKYNYILAVI